MEAVAGAELQPRELAEGEMLEEGELPADAENRETKVDEPEETKPQKLKQRKK